MKKKNVSANQIFNPLTVYIYAHIKFPRTAKGTQVEESLYNRLFIGHYKSVAYQAVSITLPVGCSMVSCLVLSIAKNIHWVPKQDPKVEVHHLVAYHFSPVGGQLRHIALQATIRLQGGFPVG